MTKKGLATHLREKQKKLKYISTEVIDSLTDDEIIENYIICSCCGEKLVEGKDLNLAIELSKNADHFLDICESVATELSEIIHNKDNKLC